MIKVGMLRNDSQIPTIAIAAALAANYYGMEFFYFRPKDVDIENKTINASFFIEGKWIKRLTGYPDVVKNGVRRREFRELYDSLSKHSILMTYHVRDKYTVFQKIRIEDTYSNLLIPTDNATGFRDVLNFLDQYRHIVLKPKAGNKGIGIYFIEKNEKGYSVVFNKDKFLATEPELKDLFDGIIAETPYIMQQYIRCLTKEHLPFDIRIHIQRGREGKWRIIKIYPRIGVSGGLTSNLSQGGAVGKIESFLKRQFGNEHEEIINRLNKLGTELPEHIQKWHKNQIDALGIDIGIDTNKKFWLFEVNSNPGVLFIELESQICALEYAQYLATNINSRQHYNKDRAENIID